MVKKKKELSFGWGAGVLSNSTALSSAPLTSTFALLYSSYRTYHHLTLCVFGYFFPTKMQVL